MNENFQHLILEVEDRIREILESKYEDGSTSDKELADSIRVISRALNSLLTMADRRGLQIDLDLTRIPCGGENRTFKTVFVRKVTKSI